MPLCLYFTKRPSKTGWHNDKEAGPKGQLLFYLWESYRELFDRLFPSASARELPALVTVILNTFLHCHSERSEESETEGFNV